MSFCYNGEVAATYEVGMIKKQGGKCMTKKEKRMSASSLNFLFLGSVFLFMVAVVVSYVFADQIYALLHENGVAFGRSQLSWARLGVFIVFLEVVLLVFKSGLSFGENKPIMGLRSVLSLSILFVVAGLTFFVIRTPAGLYERYTVTYVDVVHSLPSSGVEKNEIELYKSNGSLTSNIRGQFVSWLSTHKHKISMALWLWTATPPEQRVVSNDFNSFLVRQFLKSLHADLTKDKYLQVSNELICVVEAKRASREMYPTFLVDGAKSATAVLFVVIFAAVVLLKLSFELVVRRKF